MIHFENFNSFSVKSQHHFRAALIGHATRGRRVGNRVTRRGSACSQLFTDCPTDSDSLLDYFNNHNGGIINQVQPSVDNEVGPIIQAILADVVTGDDGGRPPQTAAAIAGEGSADGSFVNSDLFQAGDALFTNAIINGLTGGLTDAFEGGLDSIVDSIVGRKRK